MKLVLERFGFGHDSTLGALGIMRGDTGPVDHECFVIEDERRKVKVPGETCIPDKVYRVKLRTHGGFHERYKAKFGDMHKGMLEVVDVPGFSDILFHLGNTDDDTKGCLLVVTTPLLTPLGEFHGGESEKAYRKLYPKVAGALVDGEPVTLIVREREAA